MSDHLTAEQQALVSLLVTAFLLEPSEITLLATEIVQARLDSMQAAYKQASTTVAASPAEVTVSEETHQAIQDQSTQDAQSVADTYRQDLTAQTTALVLAYVASRGTLDGCEASVRSDLTTWARSRADWKSEQIANVTCGTGVDDGMNSWIDDLLAGNVSLPDGINGDQIGIAVLPATSSSDVCADYAGDVYTLDDVDTLPRFPMHPGCVHRKEVYVFTS